MWYHYPYCDTTLSNDVSPAGPGVVNDLDTSPDITSILVMWQLPDENRGRDFVTGYIVEHQLSPSGNTIRRTPLNGSTTSHIVSNLLPGTFYQITVTAVVGDRIRGDPLHITQRTQEIGGASVRLHSNRLLAGRMLPETQC